MTTSSPPPSPRPPASAPALAAPPAGPAPGPAPSAPLAPSAPPGRRGTGRAVWAALAVVYLVWGSTYLGIRVVVETMPPFLSAAARFLVAGALLAALVRWRTGPAALRVGRRELGSAALVGLLLLLGGNAMVVVAERSVPSGLAALLVAVVPAWVVLLRRVTGDRPGPGALAGVLLGLAGLGVLTLPGLGGEIRIGAVLTVVAGTVMWAVGSFTSGRLPMPANPFAASAYEMLAGGLGCLVAGLVAGEWRGLDVSAWSARSWTALGYLVVFGSLVAFTAYAWLLQRAPLGLVATYAYVNPVVAVALGVLLLGEELTGPVLLGGAIVLAGVCLIVSTERGR